MLLHTVILHQQFSVLHTRTHTGSCILRGCRSTPLTRVASQSFVFNIFDLSVELPCTSTSCGPSPTPVYHRNKTRNTRGKTRSLKQKGKQEDTGRVKVSHFPCSDGSPTHSFMNCLVFEICSMHCNSVGLYSCSCHCLCNKTWHLPMNERSGRLIYANMTLT